MRDKHLVAGRYEVRGPIGEGGMGTVYRAVDLQSKRPVAIKQLKTQVIREEPGIIERFRREGLALRRLNHPNIVRVLGIIEEENNHYIIMEYVSGGSLHDLIQRAGQVPIAQVLAISLELSDALARAHHLNIIHRDLKPANVLLASDGTPRLTDFGIAHIGDQSRLTKTFAVLGTLNYLSPEALNGKNLDARSDIWSFGIMLYEMLTGDVPFRKDSMGATVTAIFSQDLPDLAQLRPDAPPALVALVRRMLARDMDQRVGSARLVGAELHALSQASSGSAHLMVPSPLQGLSHNVALQNAAAAQDLMADLLALVQKWEAAAQESQTRLDYARDNDLATIYYHRARSGLLAEAAADVRGLIEGAQPGFMEPQQHAYAEVPRRHVEKLFRLAKVKYTNLYEDQGSIFTAILPTLLAQSLEKRLEALRALAPGLIVIESGTVDSTGEAFLDFAFDRPLELD